MIDKTTLCYNYLYGSHVKILVSRLSKMEHPDNCTAIQRPAITTSCVVAVQVLASNHFKGIANL